jgi:enoyl-CoA hydratase/carnithine racemase
MMHPLGELSYTTLKVRVPRPHVLVVWMNRPAAMNAMNTAMIEESHDLHTRLEAEPQSIRCAILTGEGMGFSAGGDIKERAHMSEEAATRQHEMAERLALMRIDGSVPWIAAVHGACLAGGLEAALTCDFIIADETARMALTECSLGMMPGLMGTQTLARAAGERRAKQLILSAQRFSAHEDAQWGIVNEVVPKGEALTRALEVADAIAACAPLAVRQARKAIHFGLQTDLRTGYRLELEAWYRLLGTQDRREGIAAFVEKRLPLFEGR